MTQIQKMQLMNLVERVLHVPGNKAVGILEMAIVINTALPKEEAAQTCQELVTALKQHSDTFRNVRLNLVLWNNDTEITHQVVSAALLQMGSCFEGYEQHPDAERHLEYLALDLKKYEARSRLLFFITDHHYEVGDMDLLQSAMEPFLRRRLILMQGDTYQAGVGNLESIVRTIEKNE